MIIKDYSPEGDINIYDDVNTVKVILNPDPELLSSWVGMFNFKLDLPEGMNPVTVFFKDNEDNACFIKVYHLCYICNDNGKTIETVRPF